MNESSQNNNQDFTEKNKNYKKCKKLISSCQETISTYENLLEENKFEGIKNTDSLALIEKNINSEENNLTIEQLFEYLASIKKIKSNLDM